MSNSSPLTQFDDSTKLKLEIFKRYAAIWINIFLKGNIATQIHIFDLFSGPGRDKSNTAGTPIILDEQIQRYINEIEIPKACKYIRLYLSDINPEYIDNLKTILPSKIMGLYERQVFNFHFLDVLKKEKTILGDNDFAKLLILDQYGFTDITPEIISSIMRYPKTDVLFFVSSSYVHRFWNDPNIQKLFNPNADIQEHPEHEKIHRFICSRFHDLTKSNIDYYFAQFSIKKDNSGNIYGVIFGTKSLLGLDKFLEVCWDKDSVAGEANYDMYGDRNKQNQGTLFTPFKQEIFESELFEFLQKSKVDNTKVYEFTLSHGFRPRDANKLLKAFEGSGAITITKTRKTGREIRGYGVSWKYYRLRDRCVWFEAGQKK